MANPLTRAIECSDRFDDLFHRLYPRLFGLVYRLLGDAGEVEDTLQEAFLKLVGAAVLERPDEEVAAWLRRVCLNLGANRLRRRRRAEEWAERGSRLQIAGAAADQDPAAVLLRHEERDAVRQVLAKLPSRQRDCLLLRYSGHSYAEIAATLGLAVGSVGVLLARAERAFRHHYQERAHETDDALS